MNIENLKYEGVLIVQATFLLVLFLVALSLDAWAAASLSWPFYLIMVTLGLLVTAPISFSISRPKKPLWLLAAFVMSLFTLRFLCLSPVKPFTQFHRDLALGMTNRQVQHLLSQRFPAQGKFKRPVVSYGVGIPFDPRYGVQVTATPTQSFHYILDLTDGRYNAETLTVYFRDGKIVGTQYSPD